MDVKNASLQTSVNSTIDSGTTESHEYVEKLYDHYKETCELTRAAIVERNKLFVYVCVLTGALFLFISNPDMIFGILLQVIRFKYEVDISVSINAAQSLVWVLLLFFLVRYIQRNCYIERQYNYQNELEDRLADAGFKITREGKAYNSVYPIVLSLIDRIYKWMFPFILTTITIIKEITEVIDVVTGKAYVGTLNLVIHTGIALVIVVLCVLYFVFISGIEYKLVKKERKGKTDQQHGKSTTSALPE